MTKQTLKIFIDVEDHFQAKAEYVFKEFCRYHKIIPDFVMEVNDCDLYYGADIDLQNNRISIYHNPLSSIFFQEKQIYPIEDVLFIFYESIKLPFLFPNQVNKIDYKAQDIISSAFYFLSCWQEYVLEDDILPEERYDYKKSMQYQLGFLEQPVVDFYCKIFGDIIQKFLSPNTEYSFTYYLSHDIDYYNYWTKKHLYAIYKYNFKRFIKNPINSAYKLIGHFLTKNIIYKPDKVLKKLLNKEQKLGFKSTSYLLTKSDINDDRQEYMRNKEQLDSIKEIFEEENVALHGSKNASVNINLLKEELDLIKQSGFNVKGYRNHFLCFNYQKSFKILEELGFENDSTLGFWEHIGFRAGTSLPFYPFNIEENRAFNVLEIPLCIMDVTLFSKKAMNLNYFKAKKKVFEMIDKAYKNKTNITILWHNYSFDCIDFPLWGKLYWDILKYLKIIRTVIRSE